MAKRLLKGDIFEVPLNDNIRGYFQYIGVDESELSSYVIKVFKKRYQIKEVLELEDIVKDEVQFYARVIIQLGEKMNLWHKVGRIKDIRDTDSIFFRVPNRPKNYISGESVSSWKLWQMNERAVEVDNSSSELQSAYIGAIVSPVDIVDRMQTGEYKFIYATIV